MDKLSELLRNTETELRKVHNKISDTIIHNALWKEDIDHIEGMLISTLIVIHVAKEKAIKDEFIEWQTK